MGDGSVYLSRVYRKRLRMKILFFVTLLITLAVFTLAAESDSYCAKTKPQYDNGELGYWAQAGYYLLCVYGEIYERAHVWGVMKDRFKKNQTIKE